MRTPIPKKRINQSSVDSKNVDITTGTVRFPRTTKHTGLGSGQLLNGNPVIQSIYTTPPEPSIIERSPENTFVCFIDTNPLGVQLTMIDDAGDRFKLSGRQITAGPTPTDYAQATYHVITVTAGSGMYTYTKNITIQVIDDGGGGPTDYIQDQDSAYVLDQDGNFTWA